MATINRSTILKTINSKFQIKSNGISTNGGRIPNSVAKLLLGGNQSNIKTETHDIDKATDMLIKEILTAMPTLRRGGTLANSFSASDFIISSPEQKGESIEVEITISENAKHRNSLYPTKYPNGADIILLFNNGYQAKGQVFGEWHGQMTHSLTQRSGSHFLQKAIENFNSQYGSIYGCQAIVDTKYE